MADIGLDVGARAHLVEAADVAGWLPAAARHGHKWQSAVRVVAGSPGMTGPPIWAPAPPGRGGLRALSSPGVDDDPPPRPRSWAGPPGARLGRRRAGRCRPLRRAGRRPRPREPATAAAEVRALVAAGPRPSWSTVTGSRHWARRRGRDGAGRAVPAVLTPHEGEFARLTGRPPGPTDRRRARPGGVDRRGGAAQGPSDGRGRSRRRRVGHTTGDARLATAGTGDVLTGMVAAFLAGGPRHCRAAAGAAFLHGRAGAVGWRHGLVASDLLDRLPIAIDLLQE